MEWYKISAGKELSSKRENETFKKSLTIEGTTRIEN